MPAVLDVTPHRASAMLFAFDGSTRDSTLAGAVSFRRPPHSMLPLLFSASLCSTSPAVFLERVTVPVCATRLTPATTVSDTAPRYLRVPPGLRRRIHGPTT
ncbi:hypothetical protein MSAN_02525900 [Mycena sanguinolenta]|uniref:Uncharacterized protein n=1 Tax=Mycena sanguinolenta TaxID=230812 RepID=A0A8H6TVZ1_9AGAR|nr:hypothetical protein MSAN_02525900 [Mycena sanguinolenta]